MCPSVSDFDRYSLTIARWLIHVHDANLKPGNYTNPWDVTAEQQAIAARGAFDTAWTDALSTGWTDKELRQLGLSAPTQTTARPRSRRKSATVSGSREDS